MAADDGATQLADHNIRRQIFLERWGDRVAARLLALIDAVGRDIIAQLALQDGISEFSRLRREQLIAQLEAIAVGLGDSLLNQLDPQLRELVGAEIASQARALATSGISIALDVLSAEQVYAAAVSQPFQGRYLRDWFRSLDEALRDRVSQAVRIGFVEGESTQQIVRRLRGTKANNYRDGVLEISRRDATAITRTAVTHFANKAKQEVYKLAPEVERYLWVSVLDRRTTPICRGRSGKIYDMGKGPLPPAHIGCRSVITAILEGLPNPTFTTYSDWLKRQPRAFIDDLLGDTRARLFTEGKLPIDRFVNVSTGRVYTLGELARREAKAWARAGLNEAA